jgi:RNA 3'-terminal phosphate cyclase (ATP)
MTIEIDGAQGEGGGQVLRTALTLAMCTGKDIVVKNIRAGRQRPGLLRQHLTALNAARDICNATVKGNELGSVEIEFSPKAINAGAYEFKIGTAGSTTLLAQTIFPALMRADNASTISMEGGTHNGMAPSVDFIEQSFLPQLRKAGLGIESNLAVHGFYPNGGGAWQLKVLPINQLAPIVLTERGEAMQHAAVVTSSNIEASIAERELARVRKKLGWQENQLHTKQVASPGPGNIVSIRLAYEQVTEVFESVGALGVPAERVAGRAIAPAKRYIESSHAVGEYLADQLLVPMVTGSGGEFTTGELSEHTKTNIAVIEQMLEKQCIAVIKSNGGNLIQVSPY